MTPNQKIGRVIQWLTEEHLWADGGYPYAYEIYQGRLFIATEDEGRTAIGTYEVEDLADWYDRAASYLKEAGCGEGSWPEMTGMFFGEWSEAFEETRGEI